MSQTNELIQALPELPVPPNPASDSKQQFIVKAEAFTRAQKQFGDQLNSDFVPKVNAIGGDISVVVTNLPAIQAAPGHAAAAAQSAAQAGTSAQAADAAKAAAEAAQAGAEAARAEAETARDEAETAKTAAEAARDAAQAAQSGAETARDAAEASRTAAETSETNAAAGATAATQKAGEASDSATAALAARTAAETALDGAETARDAAITAKTEAEAARDAAQAIVGITLSDAVDSDSSETAASSKAVKTAYDKAVEATGVPVGASLSWGGMQEPEGWLFANGGLARKADYPALYAAIGDAYGGADVPSDSFRLPNLREYADVSPIKRVFSGNCQILDLNVATGDVVFTDAASANGVRLLRDGATDPEDLPYCPVHASDLAFDSSNGHLWCAGTLKANTSHHAIAVLRNGNWEIVVSGTNRLAVAALAVNPVSHDVWYAENYPVHKVNVLRGGTGEPLSVWDSGVPGLITSIRCDPSSGDVWTFSNAGGLFVARGGVGEIQNAIAMQGWNNGKLAVNPVTGDVHMTAYHLTTYMSITLPGGGGARVDCEMPGVQGIASLSPDSVSGWLWAVYQYNGPTGNSMFGVALRRDIRAGWEYFPYGSHLSWCAVNPATHDVWVGGGNGLYFIRGNTIFFRILRAA